MRRPSTRLIAAVLAVYPPALRDRYGPEIADLVSGSGRPWRDLTDVIWNATLERIGSVRRAPLRHYAVRAGALMFAPMLFYVALMVAAPIMSILSGAFGALFGQGYIRIGSEVGIQTGLSEGAFLAAGFVGVAAVAALAVVNAHQWTAALRVPAPTVVVPTMLVLGSAGTTMAIVAMNTLLNLRNGGGWGPEWVTVPVSAAVWWVLLSASLARHRTLTRRGQTVAARLVVTAATVATPVVCGAIQLLGAQSYNRGGLFPLFGFTPLAAICTPFAFALLRVAARDPYAALPADAGHGSRGNG